MDLQQIVADLVHVPRCLHLELQDRDEHGGRPLQLFPPAPGRHAGGATCVEQTCRCPEGLEIPKALARVHARVHQLVADGLHPGRPDAARREVSPGPHQVRVLSSEVPERKAAGASGVARFLVENTGSELWLAPEHTRKGRAAIAVAARTNGRAAGSTALRQNVSPGQRSHLVVEFRAPRRPGRYDFRVDLTPMTGRRRANRTTLFHRGTLTVEAPREGRIVRRRRAGASAS